MNKLLPVTLFLLLLSLVRPDMAGGHAFPDRSEPRVGATVSAASRVRIWFDGDLEPAFSSIKVLNASGQKVDKGDGRVNPSDAALLEVSLPAIPPGAYRVIWDVVARDGHRTRGDYPFSIKQETFAGE